MSIPLTIQGVTYNYPTEGDLGWGQQATAWAAAVTNALGPGSNATFLTVHVTGSSALDGAVTAGSTLSVAGLTTMLGGAAITGAVTMSSTLSVAGLATMLGSASVGAALSVGTTLGVTGAATLGSSLTVTGAAQINNTLGVTGLATIASVSVAGAATFGVSPTAPTPASGDNTTKLATTAFARGLATGPAFAAQPNVAQVLPAAAATLLLFQTEDFDTNNNFSSNRFTPTVEGYYDITSRLSGVSATAISLLLYKNGAAHSSMFLASANAIEVSSLIYMNGTTDYVEAFGYFGVSQATSIGSNQTCIQGFLARAA